MMWGYDGFGGSGMGIAMLLFWGLLIVGVVALARVLRGTSGSGAGVPMPRGKLPMDILAERYAKGEIDKSEFEQKREDLRGVHTPLCR